MPYFLAVASVSEMNRWISFGSRLLFFAHAGPSTPGHSYARKFRILKHLTPISAYLAISDSLGGMVRA